MNKKILALKILLPIFVVLIALLIVFEVKCYEWHDNSQENGFVLVFSLLFNIIPMIAMGILGIALALNTLALFLKKDKTSSAVAALVISCLLLPFIGFSVYIDIAMLQTFAEVPIIAALVLAVNIAAMIICCTVIHEHRKRKPENLEG